MFLTAAWYLLKARQRRNQGLYDRETFRLFALAVRRRGCLVNWWPVVAYVQFLRDLGHPPSVRWVSLMLDHYAGLLGSRQRQNVLRLAAEVLPQRLLEVAESSGAVTTVTPALAKHLDAYKGSHLASIDAMQMQWRMEFKQWLLLQCASAGLCVVGNASGLAGTKLGEHIDGHGAVVRFNRFADGGQFIQDVGKQLDVWVLSPGYRGPAPVAVKWVVVAGPDVRYTLRNWSVVLPLLQSGARVLTVPLPVWRVLVRQLKAPPSAGILFLQWLQLMIGGWRGITVAGVGEWRGAGAYHLALRHHQADSRHQWFAEHTLVADWCLEGLVRLRSGAVPVSGRLV